MMIRVLATIAFAAALLASGMIAPGFAQSPEDVFDVDVFADPTDRLEPPGPDNETLTSFALPDFPPMPNIEVEAPPPAASAAQLDGTMAPPPPSACITEDEYNQAMLGSGCDCSCNGYAALPGQPAAEQRRCMAVCGMPYYRCWAPQPTEGDIAEAVAEMGPAGPEMLAQPDGRAMLTGAIMLQRASDWHDARMCTR